MDELQKNQNKYFSPEEQETIINFNFAEKNASVYTRDPSIIRRFDSLINEYPRVYKLVRATSYDRTYEMPKILVNYRGPRNLNDTERIKKRERMLEINRKKWRNNKDDDGNDIA